MASLACVPSKPTMMSWSDFFLDCHFGYHCVNFRIGEGKGLGIDCADKECDEKA